MGRFIVRRLLSMAAVLLAISILTFLIFQAIPNGDPAVRLAGAAEPVDHHRPVRGRHRQLAAVGVRAAAGAEEGRPLKRRGRVGGLEHRALGVVGDHDHGIAVEEPVEPSGRLDQEPEPAVGDLDRPDHVAAAVLGGVGLVQVEEQEVEAVPGDEPAADGAAVAVDPTPEIARRAGLEGDPAGRSH